MCSRDRWWFCYITFKIPGLRSWEKWGEPRTEPHKITTSVRGKVLGLGPEGARVRTFDEEMGSKITASRESAGHLRAWDGNMKRAVVVDPVGALPGLGCSTQAAARPLTTGHILGP